ncbi:MAG: S9 family peptidase, partial [Pricia sp.]
MKKLTTLLAIALVWACAEEKKSEPSIAETMKTYTIEQMMDNEDIGGGSFSLDNSKLLVSSNRSGIYNMYTVDASGGELMPMTESDSSSVFGISYFPEDERILFRMDGNGDEIYHIYLRDTTGSSKDLTPNEGARAGFQRWTDDEKSFLYTSNQRDPKFEDLYEMDIEDFSSTMLYKNEGGYFIGGLSDDQKWLSLINPINTNDSDLFLYDMENKLMVKVNEKQSANSPADFSPDGKSLYYTTDAEGEFAQLMKYNIAEKSRKKVLSKDWDIMGSYFTENGTYQVTYINEDAKNSIEIMEVATGENIELPAL